MVIGEIRISAEDIFDTSDPAEDTWLFRWANRLHIQTRPEVIRRALLFKSGDALSARLIDETERLLRASRYLYDVKIVPVAAADGVVDIEVVTRDTWSLDPGLSASRSGGANTSRFELSESNLLGTGLALSFGRARGVDRTSSEFEVSGDRAFGTWTAFSYQHASNSDGKRNAAAVVRPFYALDARWAAGVSGFRDDRVDAVYNAGEITSQFRHRETRAQVFVGVSDGLVDGWVHRVSVGVSLQDDRYAPEPGQVSPPELPADQTLVAPFVRYGVVEDRFERELNRNLIGRPEFFALGLASTLQLGRALPSLGSSRSAWLYNGSISRGFRPFGEHTLILAASASGQVEERRVRRGRFGLQAQYYLPQGPHRLVYASAAADVLQRPDVGTALLLGGDNGLRGYPLRYQSGTRRALFVLEQRFYTDLFVWRLFRLGGAAFVEFGRAWGGADTNLSNPGWLGNAGAGLRIVSARSAFSNVIHMDIAFPFNATSDIKKVQFLVKTRTSF